MNPKFLLLVIASLAILNSCTKESFTPITEEPIKGSAIELVYEKEASNLPETYEINDRSRFFVPPPSVEEACKNSLPSVIVPKMYKRTLEFIYAKNSSYTGPELANVKSYQWMVNGRAYSNASTNLSIPYRVGNVFNIELTVTFTDGSTHQFSFAFEASPGLETFSDGTIKHQTGASSFNGSSISQNCADEANRGSTIVIIDPVF